MSCWDIHFPGQVSDFTLNNGTIVGLLASRVELSWEETLKRLVVLFAHRQSENVRLKSLRYFEHIIYIICASLYCDNWYSIGRTKTERQRIFTWTSCRRASNCNYSRKSSSLLISIFSVKEDIHKPHQRAKLDNGWRKDFWTLVVSIYIPDMYSFSDTRSDKKTVT
jgi:hypothetical protein